ncbi:MAG: hypothetical protein LBR37_03065, partial [Erysipelotrichaceae bacterium]|nr:hypothetical protein [Erysipelotrichaceae bacterium]
LLDLLNRLGIIFFTNHFNRKYLEPKFEKLKQNQALFYQIEKYKGEIFLHPYRIIRAVIICLTVTFILVINSILSLVPLITLVVFMILKHMFFHHYRIRNDFINQLMEHQIFMTNGIMTYETIQRKAKHFAHLVNFFQVMELLVIIVMALLPLLIQGLTSLNSFLFYLGTLFLLKMEFDQIAALLLDQRKEHLQGKIAFYNLLNI